MATDASRQLIRPQRQALLCGIYVILNQSPQTLDLAGAVLAAGVRVIQYRAKSGIVADRLRMLRALTRERGALLILNDDWRAAMEFDCDGVHLGPDDDGFANLAAVRATMKERLVGVSAGTFDEVETANAAGVDYLGIGSIYATASKEDAGAPIGVDALRTLVRASAAPVAAIGGIAAVTVSQVRNAGAAMAAVISAIASASDPERAARELIDAWNA
jgi:thiamine-phosphate pyrophosphorylase